jgi:hypothetical protein
MKGVFIHNVGYIQFSSPVINCPQWQLFTGLNPQKRLDRVNSGRGKTAQAERICSALSEVC